MAIPDRPERLSYRYHQHDYPMDAPFRAEEGAITREVLLPQNSAVRGKFYSLHADLQRLVEEARAKKISASLKSLGSTYEGRKIYCLIFGGNSSKKILLTGGVHACEWIGVEVPYLAAEYLIKNYDRRGRGPEQRILNYLVDDRQIYVVPMVNPDGHAFSVETDRKWRKNRHKIKFSIDSPNKFWSPKAGDKLSYMARQSGSGKKYIGKSRQVEVSDGDVFYGVDCNRNFPHRKWGIETYLDDEVKRTSYFQDREKVLLAQQTSADPSKPTYCGLAKGSERETRAICKLFDNNNFLASIDFHSYGKYILYPDDAAGDGFTEWLGGCMEKLIDESTRRHLRTVTHGQKKRLGRWWGGTRLRPHYSLGTPSSLMYAAPGSLMAYSYQMGPRPAYTIELDPNENTRPGHELPADRIEEVCERNIRAILALIRCAVRDPRASDHLATRSVRRIGFAFRKPTTCCDIFKNWDVFGRGNKLPL